MSLLSFFAFLLVAIILIIQNRKIKGAQATAYDALVKGSQLRKDVQADALAVVNLTASVSDIDDEVQGLDADMESVWRQIDVVKKDVKALQPVVEHVPIPENKGAEEIRKIADTYVQMRSSGATAVTDGLNSTVSLLKPTPAKTKKPSKKATKTRKTVRKTATKR